jgi:hypothetical protein
MLIVETIAKVRRAYFGHGKSIKAICRELGLSRKVVLKVVRSGATEFHYERESQPFPRIGAWKDALDELLTANEQKPSRQRLTLIRIFEELRGRGYEGGYDAVRRYARRWSKEHGQSMAAAYVPLSFAPGEAYQFDSHGGPLGQEFSLQSARFFRLPVSIGASGFDRSGCFRPRSCVDHSLLAARMASVRRGSRMQAPAKPECAKRMSLTRVSSSRRKYCRQRTAVATSRLDQARTLAASRSMI